MATEPAPDRPQPRWRRAEWASLAAIVFLAAVNVYRAWSQPLTCDEAFAWYEFLRGPITKVFGSYQAGNHVLQSALSFLAFHWFSLREFTLRLPSLLGGFLYLVTAWRLARLLFGGGWFHLLAVLALTLNPFVLDYLTAARGYGLGVALMLWGFYHLVCHLSAAEPRASELYKAGIALGLSVASNLVFLYPAVALTGVAALLLALDGGFKGRQAAAQRLWLVVDTLAGPGLVTAFVLLVVPLSHVKAGDFYYGADSLAESSRSIVLPSLFYRGHLGMAERYLPRIDLWQKAFQLVIIPGLLILAVGAAAWLLAIMIRRRGLGELERIERLLLLVGGTLGALVAMLLVSHFAVHLPYPMDRTGIYWAPLLTLAALALAWKLLRPAHRLAASPVVAVLVVSVALFADGFNTGYYREWLYDRSTRTIVNLIRARERTAPRAHVRIGAPWPLQPSLHFYRHLYRLNWMEPPQGLEAGPADYYLLLRGERSVIERRHLTVLFRDELAGEMLAVPGADR